MKESILGLVRHVLTTGGGWLAGRGLLTGDEAAALAGAIVTIVGAVWSVLEKRQRTP